jgi:hypothetical protein
MGVFRAILFAALVVATPLCAGAQIGDGQGELPGGPWTPPPARPSGPPPACQQLLALRDETQKHGTAIQKANERKATVQDACKLFRNFLVAEAKFIKSLEENTRTCGVPGDAIKQAKEGHAKASQNGKEVCDAAARGPRRAGTDPWDALQDFQNPGRFETHEDKCNLCWDTGDFGLPLPRR